MFFDDGHGVYRRLSDIERIAEDRSNLKRGQRGDYFVHLKGDEKVKLGWPSVEELVRLSGKIVPAHRNTYVIDYSPEFEQVFKTPVIAWSLTHDEGVIPFTINGFNNGVDGGISVLFPDDQVMQFHIGPMSLEEWLEDQKRGSRESLTNA